MSGGEADESLEGDELLFAEGADGDGERDGVGGGVEALEQEGGGLLRAAHGAGGEALLQAVALVDDDVFDGGGQRDLVEHGADAEIVAFDARGFLERVQMQAAGGPELAPLLEADLEQVAVDRFGAVDADHAVDEAAAAAVFARAEELAGGVAGGPGALGAVLAPGQHGAGDELAAQGGEGGEAFSRELGWRFGCEVGFGLVHGRRYRRGAEGAMGAALEGVQRLLRVTINLEGPVEVKAKYRGLSTTRWTKRLSIASVEMTCLLEWLR